MKNLIFLLFVTLSLPVLGQNFFSPGYIVTTEGDTIRGLILEMSDAEMSRKLNFKKSENAELQKFTTHNLVSFGFDSGREFQRQVMLPKWGMKADTTFLFAKNILRGETDVYVGRRFPKRHPEIFLYNNSNQTSVQIYRSRNQKAIEMEDFLSQFYKNSPALPNPQPVRFRENKLLEFIAEKNEMAAASFPVYEYREQTEHIWDLMAGMPIDYNNTAYHFRGAVYYNRTKPERTSKFSSIHGIIYHHWERKEFSVPALHLESLFDTKWQMINVVPIGIKFQGNSGNFRPYGYIGAGVALLRETYISRDDNLSGEEHTRYKVLPTVNSGIGMRTRVGNHYFITELTPTINNVFLNIGLSI